MLLIHINLQSQGSTFPVWTAVDSGDEEGAERRGILVAEQVGGGGVLDAEGGGGGGGAVGRLHDTALTP